MNEKFSCLNSLSNCKPPQNSECVQPNKSKEKASSNSSKLKWQMSSPNSNILNYTSLLNMSSVGGSNIKERYKVQRDKDYKQQESSRTSKIHIKECSNTQRESNFKDRREHGCSSIRDETRRTRQCRNQEQRTKSVQRLQQTNCQSDYQDYPIFIDKTIPSSIDMELNTNSQRFSNSHKSTFDKTQANKKSKISTISRKNIHKLTELSSNEIRTSELNRNEISEFYKTDNTEKENSYKNLNSQHSNRISKQKYQKDITLSNFSRKSVNNKKTYQL